VSVHNTVAEAASFAAVSDGLDNEDAETLLRHKYLWVDEWVRRQNGDQYIIVALHTGCVYDLSNVAAWVEEKEGATEGLATHMLLTVTIDRSQSCPENVTRTITFADSKEELLDASVYIPGYYWTDEPVKLSLEECAALRNDNTLYVERSKEVTQFYQLFTVEDGNWLDLNNFLDKCNVK
jgi:hypothetical protein